MDQFIDIGANCGYYTFQLASIGKVVHAFELNPEAIFKLKKTLDKHPSLMRLISLHVLGLSDVTRACHISSPIKHGYAQTGGTNVIKSHKKPRNRLKRIAHLTTGDAALDYENTSLAIKIDVEGHEPNILRGMKKILQDNSCILMIEALSVKMKVKIDDILSPLGYKEIDSVPTTYNYFYSNFK
ncbi:MAG: hypothetical protein CMF52_09190 [Legionellales bacterium]|nr:hypothetical protein [Legionellales bacterium]